MIEKTPILLITYRRSVNLEDILSKLLNFGFKFIYVYSNCWNNNSIHKKEVEISRKIIEDLEKKFNKKFFLNFSNIHLSVDKSITSAINWFFTNVEYGIILEDDIKISLMSMEFISSALDFYKNSNDIASITSFTEYPFNKYIETIRPRYSFMFHSWGWGTWRKVWDKFDHLEDCNYEIKKDHELFKYNSSLANSFQRILLKCKQRKIITWDYQFQNFCFINDLKNLMPTMPLVENLGIGDPFAENCLSSSQILNKLDLKKNYIKDLDINNPIDLNFKDEIILFKNKYPSLRSRLLRKLLRFLRR